MKEDVSCMLNPSYPISVRCGARISLYAGIDLQVMSAEFPEISRYTLVGPFHSYRGILVDASAECFGLQKDGTIEFDIVGQANHGVCAVAVDPWAAYEHIERLDHICGIMLESGVAVRTVSQRPSILAA